jgi:hypothetical protein
LGCANFAEAAIVTIQPPKWSDEQVRILRAAKANGLNHTQIAPLVGLTPNAVAQKVRRLGIQAEPCKQSPSITPAEAPFETSIPAIVHHQAVTDYRGGWNYREQCFDNNHLYREPVSLPAVW